MKRADASLKEDDSAAASAADPEEGGAAGSCLITAPQVELLPATVTLHTLLHARKRHVPSMGAIMRGGCSIAWVRACMTGWTLPCTRVTGMQAAAGLINGPATRSERTRAVQSIAGSRRGSAGSRSGSPRVGQPGVRPYSPPAAGMSRYSSSEAAWSQKEEGAEEERPGRLQQGWSRQGSMSQRSDDSSDPWAGEMQMRLPAASAQLPEVAEQLSASQEERGDLPLRHHVQHAELRPEGWDHP